MSRDRDLNGKENMEVWVEKFTEEIRLGGTNNGANIVSIGC